MTARRNTPDSSTVDGMKDPLVITKSDSADNIRADARGITITVAGTISILFDNGTTLPYGSLPAGHFLPLVPGTAKRVLSTGTSASMADYL